MGMVLLVLNLGALNLAMPRALPASSTALEYQLKAGFLYNFLKVVEWPPRTLPAENTPLVIGLLAADDAAAILNEALRNKTVGNRPVLVKRFELEDDLTACHLLFIARSEADRIRRILASLNAAPVLTVGETERFAHHGGKINLVMKEGRVRLEVNLEAAERSGLKISSKLASLSTLVHSPEGKEAR